MHAQRRQLQRVGRLPAMSIEDDDTDPGVKHPSVIVPPWLVMLLRLHGKHEIPGPVDDPWIQEAFRRCGLPNAHDDKDAWCSVGLCRVFDDVGVKSPRTAAARNWLHWGIPLERPRLGCVQVFDRFDPKNPLAAHVNLHVADLGTHLAGEGCNQTNAIGVDLRPRGKLLGWRWPDDPRYP